MGTMRISAGPAYKRAGSPTEKTKRKIQQTADRIFTELLSHCGQSRTLQQQRQRSIDRDLMQIGSTNL